MRKLQAWQAACDSQIVNSGTSAYCQARGRFSLTLLGQIHQRTVRKVSRRAFGTPEFDRPVKLVDGTTASMPDTSENQKVWPQTRAQKPGCGFPFMRLLWLFDLSNGVLIDWAEGSKHGHEAKLFPSLWKHLSPGDLVLGDRGLCSFAAMAALFEKGVDTLMRKHQARKLNVRSGKRLGPRDPLICMTQPAQRLRSWTKQAWSKLPPTLMGGLGEGLGVRP